MLTVGLILFVVGLVIAFGAFVFAAWNMFSGVASDDWSPLGMFAGHLGAMVAMAIGGLFSTVGIVLTIVALVMMFV